MSLPKLQFEEITLRALELSDAQGNYPKWLNDPVVTKYNSHGDKEYTKEMAMEYIQTVKNSKTHHVFAIVYKNNHIGNISLQNIDVKNSNAEFAILIGETSFYKKGIAYKAAKLILEYGFTQLKLHRIYCGTSAENRAMQKLATRLGMQQEGIRTQAMLKNKRYVDIFEYGIINPYT